jgi:anti-anti-sigma factor
MAGWTLHVTVSQRGQPATTLTFTHTPVTIGASPESDIVLTDSRVSWNHAILHVSGSHLSLIDSSTNGSFVNGARVDLGAVGLVVIHPFELELRLGPDAAASAEGGASAPACDPTAADCRLTVVQGPDELQGLSFPMPVSRRLSVGRGSEADISLPHPTVSRRHAELIPAGSGCWAIQDLGSRNGVVVNGRVTTGAELVDGDRIGIGPLIALTFSSRRAAQPGYPAPPPQGQAPFGRLAPASAPALVTAPPGPAGEGLRLSTSRAPDESRIVVLEVEGRVDGYNYTELKDKLTQIIEAGEEFVIVDLARCTYFDHTGLGVLVVAQSRLSRVRGQLRLTGLDQRLLEGLSLLRLEKLLKTAPDRQAAIDELRRCMH